MADTTTHATEEVTQWNDDFHVEYVRSNQFSEYMGQSSSSLIVMEEKLMNMPGLKVVVNLVGSLSNAEVTGASTLETNEEALDNYGHEITCTFRRNAVRISKEEEAKGPINLLNAARTQLLSWRMDKTRDNIITAFGSIDGIAYGTATTGQKNTWNAANSDRILFGAQKSNQSGVQATDLLTVDSTNDKLTGAVGSLAKRIAKTASPRIRPYRVADRLREEWYVMFCNSLAFRDFKEDIKDNPSARPASSFYVSGKSHPLIRDGDIELDGVIYREVPEIAVLSGVGAGGIDVAPCYLAGAQAIGYGLKQRNQAIFEESDYGMLRGVGVEENSGIDKLQSKYGADLIDHGVVSLFVSGVADA